jgi:DNA-binding MarR family transcriptional regulator
MENTITAREARGLAVVLHDAAWLLPRTIGREAAPGEVLPPSELEVMRLLVRRPGLSVNEVAVELGLQPSNVSAAVRGLLGRGLLERHRDGEDGRVARLVPTELARENRDRREDGWGEALAARLQQLPPTQAAELLALAAPLRRLTELLGAEGAG